MEKTLVVVTCQSLLLDPFTGVLEEEREQLHCAQVPESPLKADIMHSKGTVELDLLESAIPKMIKL